MLYKVRKPYSAYILRKNLKMSFINIIWSFIKSGLLCATPCTILDLLFDKITELCRNINIYLRTRKMSLSKNDNIRYNRQLSHQNYYLNYYYYYVNFLKFILEKIKRFIQGNLSYIAFKNWFDCRFTNYIAPL